MQLDIDSLQEIFDEKLDLLETLITTMENLEKGSRKSTMRVFGIPEEEAKSSEKAREMITEQVLKVACPDQDWIPDDIQRAFRTGTPKHNQPRMVLVTFRYSDDEFGVYVGRGAFRNCGIRVRDDLTLASESMTASS